MLKRLRKLVLKAIGPVSAWAENERWRDQQSDTRWVIGVSPLRFGSVDSFNNFLEDLRASKWSADNPTRILLVADGQRLKVAGSAADVEGRAQWLATRSESQRSNFSVEVSVDGFGEVVVQFTTDAAGRVERPQCGHEMFRESAVDMRRWLCETVDRHTVRADRRDWKAGRQVVDPIDLATDLADRQSRRLTLRSSTFGAVAGLVAGVLAQVAGAALRG